MMGSGAFVAMIAGVRFVGGGAPCTGVRRWGCPPEESRECYVAAWLVESLPLGALRWLVLVVVVYASVTLLKGRDPERRRGEDTIRVGVESADVHRHR
jgi:hypothetical protein